MWKGLLSPTFSSSETAAAAAAELTVGSVERNKKKGEEEIAAQETERLVLLTYSWTALNCCTSEKRAEAIQRAKRQIYLGKLIIIVMVT